MERKFYPVVLSVALLLSVPTAGNAALNTSDEMSASIQKQSFEYSQITENNEYWTEDKLKSAVSLDQVVMVPEESVAPPFDGRPKIPEPILHNFSVSDYNEVTVSDPVGPEFSLGGMGVQGVRVPATTGRIFLTVNGEPSYCSGSVVNTPTKNIVMTAGHCLHSGHKNKKWYSNIVFIPAYRDGQAPYGKWHAKNLTVFTGWADYSDSSRDLGFFSVFDNNRTKLVNAVGGNGFVYNASPNQAGVRVFGWPAEGRFKGNLAYFCQGSTKKSWWSSDMMIPCDMTGGASGGPWVLSRGRTENTGYIFGVTSRRTTIGQARLISTPFDVHSYNLMMGAR